ncbi:uncharacterized protein TNCV_222491 [Trichonephila clavipes]|nr:uncharacterized protein TNCV_222491 [Trichonephila clavipes]
MDVCKCIGPSQNGGTLNSCQAASPLVRWVEGEESENLAHLNRGTMSLWWMLMAAVSVATGASQLQSELGMRSKRRPSESDRVTIDLSALRPSLPGLVLYKYGDLAPKLVQVDLSSLNPRLQPHVIWPQFNELETDERPFDMENLDAIPYLSEEDTLMPKAQPQRMSRVWGDMYDFVADAPSQDRLLSLHGSLPVADEVIVPLDWEEQKGSKKKGTDKKRNVFLTNGWRAGGNRGQQTLSGAGKVHSSLNSFLSAKPSQEHRPSRKRERESEDTSASRSRQGMGQPQSSARTSLEEAARIPGQESWSVPRQYWTLPDVFGPSAVNNWQ